MRHHELSIVLLLAAGAIARSQEINARDAFYSASDMMGASAPAPKKPGPAPRKPGPVQAENKTKPPGKPSAPKAPVAAPPADPEAHFVKVSSEKLAPGLRWSVLKKTAQGLVEVGADTQFRAGDSIRLTVMSNQKGHLYVVSRGSSGVWTPLFPHPEAASQANDIVPGRKYQIPGGEGEYFTFDTQAGEERLLVLLTPQPVPDLDNVILKLANPNANQQLQAKLDDNWATGMRGSLQARDLVFTRVDAPVEKAGYAVNPTGNQVIVEVALKHQ